MAAILDLKRNTVEPDTLRRQMSRDMFPKQLNERQEVGACSARGIATGPRSHRVLAGRIPESRVPHTVRGPRVSGGAYGRMTLSLSVPVVVGALSSSGG